jgi:hypothetical protein
MQFKIDISRQAIVQPSLALVKDLLAKMASAIVLELLISLWQPAKSLPGEIKCLTTHLYHLLIVCICQ